MNEDQLTRISELLQGIETTLTSVGNKLTTMFSGVPGKFDDISAAANKTGQSISKASTQMDSWISSTAQQDETLRKFTTDADKANSQVGQMIKSITEQGLSFLGLSQRMGEATRESRDYVAAMEDMTKKGSLAIGVILGLGDALGKYNTYADAAGQDTASKLLENTREIFAQVEKIYGSFAGKTGTAAIMAPFANIAKTLGVGIEDLVAQESGVRKFESSITSLMGQFAGFKDLDRVEFTRNLENQLVKIVEQNTSVANATNLAVEEVNKFATSLMHIPGAYTSTIQLGSGMTEGMTLLEGAMRITRGTTGDYSNAVDALNLQFKSFGKTNEDALELMARTYSVSQSLGVGFKDLSDIISGVVRQFATLGDNMGSSVRLVGALSKAFKETGLGIEPTKQMVESITSAMSNLSLAQKAFMSQQTGGAGGLRGGYQMDLLMREGKMDEVYKRMEQALVGQFGKITTLEEGSRSDVAAAELTKQVQFLTQGPFGSVVKSADQAYRLLEAFKSGGTGIDMEAVGKETASAVDQAMSADRELQVRQDNTLISIQNILGQLLQESQINNAMYMREMGKEFGLTGAQPNKRYTGEALGLAGGQTMPTSPASAILGTAAEFQTFIADWAANVKEQKGLPAGGPAIPAATAPAGGEVIMPGVGPTAPKEVFVRGEVEVNITHPNGKLRKVIPIMQSPTFRAINGINPTGPLED